MRHPFIRKRSPRRALPTPIEPLEPRALLAAGDLDPTFDTDGVIVHNYPKFEQFETDIALFPDGEFAVGGTVGVTGLNHDFLAARFTPTGRPYTFFNRDGFAQTDNDARDDRIRAIALDADGNVLAAGMSGGSSIFDRRLDAMIVRYSPDGDPDAFWGNDGRAFIPNVHPYDILVQPDGKVVVVAASGNDDYLIARFTDRGLFDPAFGGGDGVVVLTPERSVTISRPGAVALAPDGAIVVVGEVGVTDDIGFGVIRLRRDGTPDTAFGGGDGMVTTVFPNFNSSGADAVGIYADGKVVAGGYADSFDRFALARYNPNGSLDTTFSSDGFLTTDLPGSGAYLQDLRILSNGAILAVGEIGQGIDASQAAIVRYRYDGSLDTSFSSDGIVTTRFGQDNAAAHSLAVRPDGRILVSASSYDDVNFDYDLVIAQLQSDIPPNGAWIAGKVYDDRNRDNQFWTGDAPLAGARVFIDADNDFAYDPGEKSVFTDAEGNYAFTFMQPGDYQWGVVPPAGYEPYLSSGFYGLPLAAGQQLSGKDLALVPKQPQFTNGTPGDDTFLVRLDPTREYFEIYNSPTATGAPSYRQHLPSSNLEHFLFVLLGGNDTVIIDASNGDPIPSSPLGEPQGIDIEGGDGLDTLRVIGRPGNDHFHSHTSYAGFYPGGGFIDHASVERTEFDGGAGLEDVTVVAGTLHLRNPQDLAKIHVTSGANLVVPPSGSNTIRATDLVLEPNARLDLNDNDLVLRITPQNRAGMLEKVRAAIATKRLFSSAAAARPTTGLAMGIRPLVSADSELVVKYTYNGDANFDGRINADDYFKIDQGFLAQPQNPTYDQGDFNYDARINADDYFLIDQAFLGQGAPLSGSAPASAAAVITEPRATISEPHEESPTRRKTRRMRRTSRF